jgi:protoporphyrinogen oxidase
MAECVVIGAGPAGLTAAWELAKHGRTSIVFEQDPDVGGLSRTCRYRGYRFDIGGHRFFTKVPYVQSLWRELLGPELLERPRLSRIHYRGRFFTYPLRPVEALLGLGPLEAVRIGASYLRARLAPSREERSFEQWVSNRFGRRLFEIFFETYTEKVWGIPCHELSADWAAQRIKNLDLAAAVRNALLGSVGHRGPVPTTLIERFHYPRLGPGQMWEACAERLERVGTRVVLGARIERLRHHGGRVERVVVRDASGAHSELEAAHVLCSMPVRDLVRALDPVPPREVVEAAERLRYRDFLTVALVVDRAELFPDQWIYVHSAEVRVGRIQNYKNWSPDMVPDPGRTALGLEYFVHEGDELWSMPDAELVALAARECAALGVARPEEIVDGAVVRVTKAYPVYDGGYQDSIATIRRFLEGLGNLQLIGRNGQHRYNNQDHSMLTGVYAARNVLGDRYDVWDVNVEADYHEEGRVVDREVPTRVAWSAERAIREAFGRYQPVALGAALGIVAGVGLFLATAVLLLRGGEPSGPNLSLLASYLLGYQVSWPGAFVGLAEAGVGGFASGWVVARLVNALVAAEGRRLVARIEAMYAMDPFEGHAP